MMWIIYLIIAALHLILLLTNFHWAEIATRLLLMPVLMIAFSQTTRLRQGFLKLLLAGLFFGWLGDIALTFSDAEMFLLGMLLFFIGHCLYAIAFWREWLEKRQRYGNRYQWGMAMPILLCYIAALWYVLPRAGEYDTPLFIYSTGILMMGMSAIRRFDKQNRPWSWLIYCSTILFMISDFLIGWDSFIQSFSYSSIAIMLTYILAQGGIAYGLSGTYSRPPVSEK